MSRLKPFKNLFKKYMFLDIVNVIDKHYIYNILYMDCIHSHKDVLLIGSIKHKYTIALTLFLMIAFKFLTNSHKSIIYDSKEIV